MFFIPNLSCPKLIIAHPLGSKLMPFSLVPKMKESVPTLPETNMAPENEPLEKEIPIGNHHL